VGPAKDGAASSTPLNLEEAGGRRHFPGLLQETAAAHFPSNGAGKRDGAILQQTGAGGLMHPSVPPSVLFSCDVHQSIGPLVFFLTMSGCLYELYM
jgi:hypothetical protein